MSVSKKLKDSQPVFGSFVLSHDPSIVRVAATAGLDFLALDFEHGLFDGPITHDFINAVYGTETELFIRCTMNEVPRLGAYFDSGLNGVIVAGCSSLEDVQKVIDVVKFPPDGKRGLNPFVPGGTFGLVSPTEFVRKANEASSVWVLVESVQLLSDLDVICTLPNLGGIFLGPYDLSVDMGRPGETNSEEVRKTLQSAIDTVLLSGQPVGIFVKDKEDARYWLENGVRFVILGVDQAVLANVWQKTIYSLRSR
ncbi:hypothetical protein LLE49_21760 [Alicyclobacillus tolerans]|uniref:HpcH/HpaI aldolase family protein n=1 Tax=Alicyclobacillus tolerans TaxID=90970 RepID=UPI001F00B42B|nr:aldolase/citrate lyase family protein [Alicyclobacillus tolerans]MCF8567351.1 hypothetical protein [Alicyclobacillus tolerans]